VSRSVPDILRRGFELTIANWPLLLIRVAEQVIGMIIMIGAVVAAVIPIAVSAGLGDWSLDRLPEDPAAIFWTLLIDHWGLLLFVLAILTVVLAIVLAIHSFVNAGSADVYLAGTFTSERFFGGAKRGWWRVFWIYNLAWLVAGIIVLIPLLPIPLVIARVGANTTSMVISCSILALWGFFAFLVAVAVAVWIVKAIVLTMQRDLSARDALREARRLIRARFGPYAAVAFILYVLWIGGFGVLSGASMGFSAGGHHGPYAMFFAPAQMAMSLLQSCWSAVMESLFLASFAAFDDNA
jgi:hypothetical protein